MLRTIHLTNEHNYTLESEIDLRVRKKQLSDFLDKNSHKCFYVCETYSSDFPRPKCQRVGNTIILQGSEACWKSVTPNPTLIETSVGYTKKI